MARRTIGLEELGGITLGSRPSRKHEDSETDKERCWCKSHKHLSHMISSIQRTKPPQIFAGLRVYPSAAAMS
jgi:hypothetical protein